MRKRNVFVLGLDPLNRRVLEQLPLAARCTFHALLDFERAKGQHGYAFDAVLDAAIAELDRFDGPIDAITGYWDFPVSSALPLLCERYGVPGPRLTSVLKCEHKYWSRLEQREAAPEVCPPFQAIDALDEESAKAIEVAYPFWLKPVKSTSSAFAYHIHDDRELEAALAEIRGGIDDLADAFDQLLAHADLLPDAVARVGGAHCLVEGTLEGRQCTVCGYVSGHRPRIYGIVDSISHPETAVFQRLQYPSRLPEEVQHRLADASTRILSRVGFNDGAFNVEFFYDQARDRIGLLEINPRISQSHGEIFGYVDGLPDQHVMVSLALGEKPEHPYRQGEFPIAAKWYYRRFENAHVDRVPSDAELRAIEQAFPGVMLKAIPEAGMELAELREQDPNAYDLAYAWIGAESEEALEQKYQAVIERLDFRFSAPEEAAEVT